MIELASEAKCAFCNGVIREGERRARFIDDDDVVHDDDKCITGYSRRYLIQIERKVKPIFKEVSVFG